MGKKIAKIEVPDTTLAIKFWNWYGTAEVGEKSKLEHPAMEEKEYSISTVDISLLACTSCLQRMGCTCLTSDPIKRQALFGFFNSLRLDGFVQITGHGVKEETISNTTDTAQFIFNKTAEEKQSLVSKDRARRGYSASSSENFASLIGQSNKPNDLVEKYRIGPVLSDIELQSDVHYYGKKESKVHFYPNNLELLPVGSVCSLTQ
jgi:hypothetical protein